jgi:reverse gyrase
VAAWLRLKRRKIFIVSVKIDDLKIEWEFEDKEKAEEFFNSLNEKIEIKLIDSKEEELFEKPFNTSTLLKEAATKLHFSPQYTMKLAQELFENGFITYHRTDSFRISNVGKKIAKEYIEENFGEEYVNLRSFESGGAHEAIRATTSMDMNELKSFLVFKNINLTYNHLKLYDLIFRKFIASQMREMKVKKDIFKVLDKEVEVNTKILENGFNLIYPVKIYEITEGIYPVEKKIYQKSKFSPYTYAEVIDEMKNKGIGRPSTYAITIEKLLERKYIVEKNGFLFVTKLGFKVLNILKKHPLYKFVSEEFTRTLEEIMDLIEQGEKDYKETLISLYYQLFS